MIVAKSRNYCKNVRNTVHNNSSNIPSFSICWKEPAAFLGKVITRITRRKVPAKVCASIRPISYFATSSPLRTSFFVFVFFFYSETRNARCPLRERTISHIFLSPAAYVCTCWYSCGENKMPTYFRLIAPRFSEPPLCLRRTSIPCTFIAPSFAPFSRMALARRITRVSTLQARLPVTLLPSVGICRRNLLKKTSLSEERYFQKFMHALESTVGKITLKGRMGITARKS